jgi:hypothetical protein
MGVGARATELEGGEKCSVSRVLLASLALYAVSFFLPALDDPQGGMARGYAAFLSALIGPAIYSIGGGVALVRESDPRWLLFLLVFLPWSANPAYWLAAYRLHIGRRRGVVTLSVLAVLLGLSPWAMLTACWLSSPAGRRGPPPYFAYREGYWLWLGSMALLVYGGWEGKGSRLDRAEAVEMAQSCDD